MSVGNVIQFRPRVSSRLPKLPREFVARDEGRPMWIVRVYDDGRMWWNNGAGGGYAGLDGAVIIIGPYKSYGSAFHADSAHPEVAADAEREIAAFEARAATLPEAPTAYQVVHWTELDGTEGWRR